MSTTETESSPAFTALPRMLSSRYPEIIRGNRVSTSARNATASLLQLGRTNHDPTLRNVDAGHEFVRKWNQKLEISIASNHEVGNGTGIPNPGHRPECLPRLVHRGQADQIALEELALARGLQVGS